MRTAANPEAAFYRWRARNPASEALLQLAVIAQDFDLWVATYDRLRQLAAVGARLETAGLEEGSDLFRRLARNLHPEHEVMQ